MRIKSTGGFRKASTRSETIHGMNPCMLLLAISRKLGRCEGSGREQLFGLSHFPKVPVTWIFEHWLYWRRTCVLWANDKLRASLRILRRSFPHSQLSDTVRRPHIDPPKTLKLDSIFKYFNL